MNPVAIALLFGSLGVLLGYVLGVYFTLREEQRRRTEREARARRYHRVVS